MNRIYLFLSFVFLTAFTLKDDLYTPEQEWKVSINDGWLSAKTISLGIYSTSSRKTGIAAASPSARFKNTKNASNFTLKGNDENILVQVLSTQAITFSDRKLPSYLSKAPATNMLFYAWINGTSTQPLQTWEIILKDPTYLDLNDNASVGILRSGKEEMRISATNRFGIMNSYERPTYEFHDGKKTLAAVMIDAQPKMWISQKADAEQQKVLTAAISALLMRS